MKALSDWRSKIDQIDREIVELLNRRAACVLELAPLKKRSNIDVLDPQREREVHRHLRQINSGPLDEESLDRIFDEIMRAMRALQSETAAAD